MSTLSEEEVRSIANLSRLDLQAEDVTEAQKYLTQITDYVDQLKEVSVDDVEPYAAAPVRVSDLRDDVAQKDDSRKELLNGDQYEDDYLVTRRIVGSDE